jgi:hypothetical protein
MAKMDKVKVESALREVAKELPNFIYVPQNYPKLPSVGCFYHKGVTGSPHPKRGCIFGEAFRKLGVSESVLKEWSAEGDINTVIDDCPASWLIVQDRQDGGATWGEAIQALDEV